MYISITRKSLEFRCDILFLALVCTIVFYIADKTIDFFYIMKYTYVNIIHIFFNFD